MPRRKKKRGTQENPQIPKRKKTTYTKSETIVFVYATHTINGSKHGCC